MCGFTHNAHQWIGNPNQPYFDSNKSRLALLGARIPFQSNGGHWAMVVVVVVVMVVVVVVYLVRLVVEMMVIVLKH